MEIILTLFYSIAFFLLILKLDFFCSTTIKPVYFGCVFALKIIAGSLLGYLYKKYFNGGDTFVFFGDACTLFNVAKTDLLSFMKMVSGLSNDSSLEKYYALMPGWNNSAYFYNDTKTIIRANALIRIFSFGYYNVHVVFFCFLSLVGLTGLFKIFSASFPEKAKALFASVFLLPSVLFWNSGILKEGLIAFALGMFIFSFAKIISGKKTVAIFIVSGISLILLIYLKVYLLAILMPGLISYWWLVKTNSNYSFLKYTFVHMIYFILLFNLKHINSNYDVSEIIFWKQHNTINYARFMNSGSYVELPRLEPTAKSIICNTPRAFITTLTLPNWKFIHNRFALVAAIENLLLLIILCITLFFLKKPLTDRQPVFLLSVFFVFFLFVLIGLTSPILGSMVRYKVPAMPFFMAVLAMLFDIDKFKRVFKIK